MSERFRFNGHCVVYCVLAIVNAAATLHCGGRVFAALCGGAAAIGYGVLAWWHRGHCPASGSASRENGAGGLAR